MFIRELQIRNFKSLRDVTFRPGKMTVVVGANGAGKSNLASAFDFISDIYTDGLLDAVMKKGGYENIAFRRIRRTKAPIEFVVEVAVEASPYFFAPTRRNPKTRTVIARHSFAFKPRSQSLRADFQVVSESLDVRRIGEDENAPFYSLDEWIKIELAGNAEPTLVYRDAGPQKDSVMIYLSRAIAEGPPEVRATSLSATPSLVSLGLMDLISVHQFSPHNARIPSPPIPNARMGNYGQNLASVVDWLKRYHPDRWLLVEESMRGIIPTLLSIETQFANNRLLGLTFDDAEAGRPWSADEISDGTIQALAILCCWADPRNGIMFLEEVENSLHPWIVGHLAKKLKSYSEATQTVLTTHSPVILNMVNPENVWVCHRDEGETKLSSLRDLHPDVAEDWESGSHRLFDFFDAGLIAEAMPKGSLE